MCARSWRYQERKAKKENSNRALLGHSERPVHGGSGRDTNVRGNDRMKWRVAAQAPRRHSPHCIVACRVVGVVLIHKQSSTKIVVEVNSELCMIAMRLDNCLTTLGHAAHKLAQILLRSLLPLIGDNVLKFLQGAALAWFHTTRKIRPKVFDRVEVGGVRGEVDALNAVVEQPRTHQR